MTVYKKFTTAAKVRPDDIDMFNHVHNSKYFDYVLAARYEQMEFNYKMPMEYFLNQGLGWVVKTAHVNYKRPLGLGDEYLVETGIESVNMKGCRVNFEIKIKKTEKVSCDGWFDFVMISLKDGKSVVIPDDIVAHYSI